MLKIIIGIIVLVLIGCAVQAIRTNPLLLIPIILIIIGIIVFGFLYFKKKRSKAAAEEAERSKKTERAKEAKRAEEAEKAERAEKRKAFIASERAAFVAELESLPMDELRIGDELPRGKKQEHKLSRITASTNIDKLFPLVIIDTETTGLRPAGDRIVEISAIKYDVGFHPIAAVSTLINPDRMIPADAAAVNHITDEMVEDAPTFGAISASLSEFIDGCNIAGYNLPFDLGFLDCSGLVLPEAKNRKLIDVEEIVKAKLKRAPYKNQDDSFDYDVNDYKLTTIADYYKIFFDGAHRSLADCLLTAKVFAALIDEFYSK